MQGWWLDANLYLYNDTSCRCVNGHDDAIESGKCNGIDDVNDVGGGTTRDRTTRPRGCG